MVSTEAWWFLLPWSGGFLRQNYSHSAHQQLAVTLSPWIKASLPCGFVLTGVHAPPAPPGAPRGGAVPGALAEPSLQAPLRQEPGPSRVRGSGSARVCAFSQAFCFKETPCMDSEASRNMAPGKQLLAVRLRGALGERRKFRKLGHLIIHLHSH